MAFEDHKPLMIRPNARGQINPLERVRAVISRWYFEDRISPVTTTEVEAAHSHGDQPVLAEGGAPHTSLGGRH